MSMSRTELLKHWADCKKTKEIIDSSNDGSIEFFECGSDTAYLKHYEYVDHFVIDATDSFWEWVLNFFTKKGGIFNAHLGFYKTAKEFVQMILESLDLSRSVVVKGHSRGGAIAILVGLLLLLSGFDVKVVTFGAPKVGGRKFYDIASRIGLKCIRVEINGDPVCSLPPSWFRKWVHYSTEEIVLESKYAKGVTKHIMYGDSLSE